MFNKSKIRKIILQEFRKRIILEEEAASGSAALEAYELPASEEAKQEIIQSLETLLSSLENSKPYTLTNEQASDFAVRIYNATKGWSGMSFNKAGAFGTDEDEIRNVLKEIPTIVDISYVSAKFETKYKGKWFFVPNLKNVFSEELDQVDMDTYVDTVINDKMNNAFIELEGLGKLGYDQFFALLTQGEEIKKAFAGEGVSSWIAGSGLVSAVASLVDDEPRTEYYIMPAARQAATAGAAISGGLPQTAVRSAASSTSQVGRQALAAANAAANQAYAATAGTAARASTTALTTSRAITPAIQRGANSAAMAAARRAGLKAGVKTLASKIPALAGKFIPIVGWAWFAADIVNYITAGDISDNTALALDSTLYKRLEKQFKEISGRLREEIASINQLPVAPDAGDQDVNTGMVEYPDLGFGHTSPYIPKIIKTLNAYAETRSLEGYTKCSGTTWTPKVQECWLAVVPHALANCDKFEEHKDIEDVSDWNAMSDEMKSDFPGYVRGPRGCCAFIMDAYYCEIRFGDKAPTSGGGGTRGGSGSGGGGGGGGTGEGDGDGGTGDRSILDLVKVRTNQTAPPNNGTSLKAHGFKMRGNRDPDIAFAKSLIQNSRKISAFPGGVATYYFNVNSDKTAIESVELDRLSGGLRGFRSGERRQIERALESMASSLIFPDTGAAYKKGEGEFDPRRRGGDGRAIKVTFNLRAGNYTPYI